MNYPRIERPTEPGWYWFRSAIRPSIWWPYRLTPDDGGELWCDDGDPEPISSMTGEWRGPIPQPESEQKEDINGKAL